MNKPITPGRITRWLLLLQEFDITIIDKLGKDNVVADFLSRMDKYLFLLNLHVMHILLIILLQ